MIRLRARGVLRVAANYAVIALLTLQIADVTFEPMGAPIALAVLARHQRDGDADAAPRPAVRGGHAYADIRSPACAVAFLLLRDSEWLAVDAGLATRPFANVSGRRKRVLNSEQQRPDGAGTRRIVSIQNRFPDSVITRMIRIVQAP